MYKDIAADNCYYQIPLGGGFFMRVSAVCEVKYILLKKYIH